MVGKSVRLVIWELKMDRANDEFVYLMFLVMQLDSDLIFKIFR